MSAPPIQNLENIDVLGRRKDGGIDLAIVVSGPLRNTADHLDRVERKIRNYIGEVSSPEFSEQFPANEASRRILLVTEYTIDPAVLALISSLRRIAVSAGVALEIVTARSFFKD